MTQLTNVNKRPSFLSFPIPFDHPFTIPTLVATVSASALLYYYLQATHTADLVEAVRKRDIKKRRQLERAEDRFASLKVKRFLPSNVDSMT
jgi:N-acyl-phosphatidylethanolamine-hydrolysing phospholipase D